MQMVAERKEVALTHPYIPRAHKGKGDLTARWSTMTYSKGEYSTLINEIKVSAPH
jgi:hypothetical protein